MDRVLSNCSSVWFGLIRSWKIDIFFLCWWEQYSLNWTFKKNILLNPLCSHHPGWWFILLYFFIRFQFECHFVIFVQFWIIKFFQVVISQTHSWNWTVQNCVINLKIWNEFSTFFFLSKLMLNFYLSTLYFRFLVQLNQRKRWKFSWKLSLGLANSDRYSLQVFCVCIEVWLGRMWSKAKKIETTNRCLTTKIA